MTKVGTEWDAYLRLIATNPSWTITTKWGSYPLSFLNFRQYLVNAYGRLQVHSRAEALAATEGAVLEQPPRKPRGGRYERG